MEIFSLLFREKISDDSAIIKVAVENSKLVGYAVANCHSAFYASSNVVWVDEIYVSHEHRGLNVGSKLMGSIEEWALVKNSSIVSLATAGAGDFTASWDTKPKPGTLKSTYEVQLRLWAKI